jgi:hypothetical protein
MQPCATGFHLTSIKTIIMKRNLLFTILALLFSAQMHAQTIDSLRIIPQPATDNDIIKVIVWTTHSSGTCEMVSQSVSISGSSIEVSVSHNLGMLSVICNSIDTITIGQLNAGSYQLVYNVYNQAMTNITDSDTLNFIIQSTLGIKDASPDAMRLYPNPASAFLTLEIDEQQYVQGTSIFIYDLFGRVIKQVTATGSETRIGCEDMSAGMYLYEVRNGNTITSKGKLIRQ